jgi:hypothetical protein
MRESGALYHLFTNQAKDEVWAVPSRRYLRKNSTESHCDLSFEGLRPEPMVECIARWKEKASQTLKAQITATNPYRYRLGGIVRASLHFKTIECSFKNPSRSFPFFSLLPF